MTEKTLVDSFGRVARDLRISVTDRCNFRCTYCLPEEGLQWGDRADILTFEEIERLAGLFVSRFGFTGIRLTGGEPTVRAHLPVLVARLARLGVDLSMTTNGASLALIAHDLRSAGLERINVSCDSLRPERFTAITRRDRLAQVIEGIDAAIAEGFAPVKVNCVLVRGVNDDEIIDFIEFGRSRGVVVRFIEFMPLDAPGDWNADHVVTYDEVLGRVAEAHPFDAVERGQAPAERFVFRDGKGEFGVVPSVTRSFCGTCDRVRLTADGQLRNCLFAVRECDLRSMLRDGATDDELARAIEREVAAKWAGHAIGQVHFIRPERSMSQIGG